MKDTYLREIQKLKNNNQLDEAIIKAKEGFKQFKDNCFNNEIYDCLMRKNKIKDAKKILEKMLKLEPESVFLLKRLAYCCYRLGKYKEAIKYYKEVTEFEPLSANNYFNLASMYHYLNDVKKAYHYYYTAAQIDPSNISVLNNMGALYYENKNWDKAIEIFNKIISISPRHPEAYHHLGIILREYKNDFELSELYIKKALRIDPKYPENSYQLALTQYKAGKIQDAMVNLDKCLELSPSHKNSLELIKTIRTQFYNNK